MNNQVKGLKNSIKPSVNKTNVRRGSTLINLNYDRILNSHRLDVTSRDTEAIINESEELSMTSSS